MTVDISGHTVAEAYKDALFKMRVHGRDEDTRAGRAISIPEPVVLTLYNPKSRVLRDPERNANPFFHVMETVWMLAGYQDATWLAQFNKRMLEFSDDIGYINGAYGYRWRDRGIDQIEQVVAKIKLDPNTRQAVIAMWDTRLDNVYGQKDYPCNTHIYFRVCRGRLNMTVCNRSNDLIWGMLGANVVHMTYLHELVSCMTGIPLGRYQVFTNNLHIYERHWHLMDYPSKIEIADEYVANAPPILADNERYKDLVLDCKNLVEGNDTIYHTSWIIRVAKPIYYLWKFRKENTWRDYARLIGDENWKTNCQEWILRKYESTDEQEKFNGTTQSDLFEAKP